METLQNQTPKIPFYKQRPFGEKMNASFDFIKENWKVMLKYITYLILPICLVQALNVNSFIGHYMNAVMGTIDGRGNSIDPSFLGTGFFVSYGFMMLFSFIGTLLITALIFALVKLYNDREERLVGVTFRDIKPLLFRNMGRIFLVGFVYVFFISAIAFVMVLLAALTPFTLILTVLLFFALLVALYMWFPVYLYENIGLGAAFSKGIRLGFATWGGVFVILLVMSIISSVLQGVVTTPWYIAVMAKSLLFYANEGGPGSEPSFLYNVMEYILAVVLLYGMYLSIIFAILGLSYQYAHATEKLDSVTVESEIDNFENL